MKANWVFRFLFVIFSIFLIQGNALAKDIQIPAPVGDIYVQDFANVLNENEKEELQSLGRSIDDQTTAQIAVLTIDTIGDSTIEEFANEAFRKYGIGSKKENNGVLLVLALNDRKVRIEVGYGLEGRLPDGKVGRILDEYTVPYLKNEQPNKAIIETYKVLTNEVLQEYGIKDLQSVEKPAQTTDEKGLGIPTWLIIVLVVIFLMIDFKFFGGNLTFFLLNILSRGGRGGGGGSGGSRPGGGGSSGGGGASRGW